MADKTAAAEVTKVAEKVEAADAVAPVAETRVEAEPKAAEPKAEPVKAEPKPVQVKTETKAIPAKVEAKPAPVKTEAKATPAKVAPKPAPAKAAPKPAPVKAKAKARKRVTKAKRTAPKTVVSQPIKAAKPAKKPASVAKAKPAKKPAVRKMTQPAPAGVTKIEGAKIMTKTNGIEAGQFAAEQFKTVFGDVNARAKAAVERSAKIVEEFADLTRGNVEAIVASSKVAAKGVETLSQEAAEYSRKSFEEASTALKSIVEVKSATDLFKLQGDFARAAFDAAVAESARLSEAMLKIAGDVAEPITSRYTVAAERVKTLAA
jgi:phasin family protein